LSYLHEPLVGQREDAFERFGEGTVGGGAHQHRMGNHRNSSKLAL
jgi:hypothetical protein